MIDIPVWAEFTFHTSDGELYYGNKDQYQAQRGQAAPANWSKNAYLSYKGRNSSKPVVLQLEND